MSIPEPPPMIPIGILAAGAHAPPVSTAYHLCECPGPDIPNHNEAFHNVGWFLIAMVLGTLWIGMPMHWSIFGPSRLTRAQTWAWYVIPFASALVYLFTR